MKKKLQKGAALLALAATISTAGIFAYLTGTDSQNNIFTIGEVKIDLKEEKWDSLKRSEDTNKDGKVDKQDIPDEAKHMYPTQNIIKDPMVDNQGNNPAWIYLQVEVPKVNAIIADENGKRLNGGNAAPVQLYTYLVNGIDNPGEWKFLASDLSGAEKNIYLYGTEHPVAPGVKTGTLFDQIVFANLVEGQIASDTEEAINITAYAIQEGNVGDSIDAWNKYSNQASGEAKASILIPSVKR